MRKTSVGARLGAFVTLTAASFAAGCGSDKVAHFSDPADAFLRPDGSTPEHDAAGGSVVPDFAPFPDAEPVDAAASDALPTDDALAGDAVASDAGTDAATDALTADAGFEPPPGDLPPFAQVGVTTAGANSHVVWAEGGVLKSRAFGPDFQWVADTADLAPIGGDLQGLAVETFSEVPWAVWGTGDNQPIQALMAEDLGGTPLLLQVTGRPVVTQLQGNLLVLGRAPGDAADRPLAWQVVDPITGTAGPLKTMAITQQVPDAAGSLGDSAVVRFGATGQCVFFDASADPIGNFACKPGREGRISSDGLTAVLVFKESSDGNIIWKVLPLLGSQGYTPYTLGNQDPSGETTDNAFPSSSGTQPVLLAYRTGAHAGELGLFFPEPTHLYTEDQTQGAVVDPWIDDGTVALVRRGTTALKVRFGYPDSPRLSVLPLHDVRFDAEKPYAFESPNVVDGCVATLEDCDPDSDLDCDGVPTNGLCCGEASVAWSHPFQPPAGVSRIAVGDVTDRNAYFVAIEGTDGTISPYFADFTDNDNNVNADGGTFMADLDVSPPGNFQRFDLTDAHGFVGALVVHAWRAVIAQNGANTLGIFWNAPSAPSLADTRPFSPLEGCEQVLAYDRVAAIKESPADALTGRIAAIVVCPDRILRVPPRISDGETVSVPIQAAAGIPVRAVWATTTRINRTALMIVVAYRTAGNTVEFLRYMASPDAGPGAPAGIGVQVAGNNGPLAGLPEGDKADPIYWNVPNTAYVQIQGSTARARTPTGQGWTWQPIVVPGAVSGFQMSDLDLQLVGGAETDAGFAFYTLSLGGDGGTSLWSSQPTMVLPGVHAPIWAVTRGAANDTVSAESNGHRYPGVLALYPDPQDASRWRIDLSGATCTRP